nr:immunoglobulin heavy chain junction region [Macaca mulatta]MOX62507.1 immunoglobulin heavy chain junction region [Macaca mulatta]MOX63157.1 immunoglobulin heavy chain junction region [Macaca mulatta]
CANGVAGLDFW